MLCFRLTTFDSFMTSNPGKIRIDRDLLKTLAQPAPLRLLVQTLAEWGCIVCLAMIAERFANVAVTFACMLLIATRQHALLTLMHDYSHYQFSRQRKQWNDLLGDVFTALPFFITIHGFRRNHQLHHRYAWTADDPNHVQVATKKRYQFPKPYRQVLAEIFKHCIGYYTFAELKRYTVSAGMSIALPRSTQIHRAAFAIVLCAVVTVQGWWMAVLLYWLLPLATFLMAILYVRDLGEHFGLPKPGFDSSRTVLPNWFERLLLAQNGVNFHAEHHRFPSIPFFRLHRLHRALMQDPAYRREAVVTSGYLTGLLGELSTAKVTPTLTAHAPVMTQPHRNTP